MLNDKPYYGKIKSWLLWMPNIRPYGAQYPLQMSQITQQLVRYIHSTVPHACFTLHCIFYTLVYLQCCTVRVEYCSIALSEFDIQLRPLTSSDISFLKFISVSVSITFSVSDHYFYIVAVLIWTIISVFISLYQSLLFYIIIAGNTYFSFK